MRPRRTTAARIGGERGKGSRWEGCHTRVESTGPAVRPAVAAVLVATLLAAVLAGCTTLRFDYQSNPETRELLARYHPAYPDVSFAVLSDPHLYDTSLGAEGEAFQEYLRHDRKLLVESEEILRVALKKIRRIHPRFLIISGDLTKDGEKVDHLLLAHYLRGLEEAGIPSYVIPGNHDILNPHAMRFDGPRTERVENVSPAEFASIYDSFGYGEALSRDPSSLSYLVEPVPGLWLLALDSADYGRSPKRKDPVTGGRFPQSRIDWIEATLRQAAARGKAVIAMMHHGVIEHYHSQAKHFPQYVVENHEKVARMLAAYGVRVVFTGHYHAQDITLERWEDGRVLYDVETGSLVTYPCPGRMVTIRSGKMRIVSGHVEQLPSFADRGEDFSAYARKTAFDGIAVIATEIMTGLGMKRQEAEELSGQTAAAFVAHYAGDERFTGGSKEEMLRLHGLSLMGRIVVGSRKDLVYGLWNDKEPPDNEIIIDLATGAWKPVD